MVHNWSGQSTEVHTPADLTDVLDGTPLPADSPVRLGPWDVRVFVAE